MFTNKQKRSVLVTYNYHWTFVFVFHLLVDDLLRMHVPTKAFIVSYVKDVLDVNVWR